MNLPVPTPIYRLVHVDNLMTLVGRGALHAPRHLPQDGLPYRPIHSPEVQAKRHVRTIPCGPQGVLHDYVPFYLGPRSPMLLQLHTGRVVGYSEGQRPLIYLTSTAQAIAAAGVRFVFSDGHGIALYSQWYDDLAQLDQVDWSTVYANYWADSPEDLDRQRRKQAEFLVYRVCPWALVDGIAVVDEAMREQVQHLFAGCDAASRRPVTVRREWYYS